MALSEAQEKSLILLETGSTTDTTIIANIDLWWDQYLPKESIRPGLRILYVKRAVIDALLGSLRKKFNVRVRGDSFNFRDQFENLIEMRQSVQDSILKAEKTAITSSSPKSSLPDSYRDFVSRVSRN